MPCANPTPHDSGIERRLLLGRRFPSFHFEKVGESAADDWWRKAAWKMTSGGGGGAGWLHGSQRGEDPPHARMHRLIDLEPHPHAGERPQPNNAMNVLGPKLICLMSDISI